MGRELKRVPLDFDHPAGETWPGYLQPDWRPCPDEDCSNGWTLSAQWLRSIVHLIMILPEEVDSVRPLHPWLEALPLRPDRRPTRQITEITTGLAGRPPGSLGHDSIDNVVATRLIGVAADLPDDWDICPTCQGCGIDPEDQTEADAWEPTEPPEGEGYQLWETTSEGSPLTPVFETLDELCEHAAEHCTVFADHQASAEGWRHMLTDGFVAAETEGPDGTRQVFI